MKDRQAYPLCWPSGWKRTASHAQKRAQFKRSERRYHEGGNGSYLQHFDLSVRDGTLRILAELFRMGVRADDVIVSTNVELRLDGLPRSDRRAPADPGVAVYWRDRGRERVMAVDRYDRVADNLAALAATLEAMRAIERHGGAAILDRAFTGFAALAAPNAPVNWRHVFGYTDDASPDATRVKLRFMELRKAQHPDHGGSHDEFIRVQEAFRLACDELGVSP